MTENKNKLKNTHLSLMNCIFEQHPDIGFKYNDEPRKMIVTFDIPKFRITFNTYKSDYIYSNNYLDNCL